MFLVSDADAAAIRAALQEGGELSAVVELRRRFRGIDSTAEARRCARIIAGWTVSKRTGATDATAREISEGAEPGEG